MNKAKSSVLLAKGDNLDNELSEVFCVLEEFIYFQIQQRQEARISQSSSKNSFNAWQSKLDYCIKAILVLLIGLLLIIILTKRIDLLI